MLTKLRLPYLLLLVVSLACIGTTAAIATDWSDKMKVSLTQRMRIETTDNATQLDNDALAGSSYFRDRTSLMLQTFPQPNWELSGKVTNEFRYYFVTETRQFNWDEVFFDVLYAKWDSVAHFPVTATLGRQNINLGEGFAVWDGGPLDGSRSGYFNAANIKWNITPQHAVSFIYVNQPRKDNLLPIIHDQEKIMVEQPEEGLVAYYSGTIQTLGIQGYFIRKNLRANGTAPDAHINCPGIRLQAPLINHLTVTGEAAVQFGTWGKANHQALGGYAYAEYQTGWPIRLPKSFTLGGIYMSGDKAGTADHEGWDPLFARWPKWSESYAYTLTREHAPAYWSNLASVFAKTAIPIIPDVTFTFDYHHLTAPQPSAATAAFPGGGGTTRGDLYIGKVTYQMNAHLSGHVLWESLNPGDFYFAGADKSGWMRTELMLTF